MQISGSLKDHYHPELEGSHYGFCTHSAKLTRKNNREDAYTRQIPTISQNRMNSTTEANKREPIVMKFPNGIMIAIISTTLSRDEQYYHQENGWKMFLKMPSGFMNVPAIFSQPFFWDYNAGNPDIDRESRQSGNIASSIQVGINYEYCTNTDLCFGVSEVRGNDQRGCDIMFLCIGKWK